MACRVDRDDAVPERPLRLDEGGEVRVVTVEQRRLSENLAELAARERRPLHRTELPLDVVDPAGAHQDLRPAPEEERQAACERERREENRQGGDGRGPGA